MLTLDGLIIKILQKRQKTMFYENYHGICLKSIVRNDSKRKKQKSNSMILHVKWMMSLWWCREKLNLNETRQEGSQGRGGKADDLRRLVNEAHPPRASDLAELHGLQKTKKEKDGVCLYGYVCRIQYSVQYGVYMMDWNNYYNSWQNYDIYKKCDQYLMQNLMWRNRNSRFLPHCVPMLVALDLE